MSGKEGVTLCLLTPDRKQWRVNIRITHGRCKLHILHGILRESTGMKRATDRAVTFAPDHVLVSKVLYQKRPTTKKKGAQHWFEYGRPNRSFVSHCV